MTFKTEIAADLTSVFFNAIEFAESVTYTPNGAAAKTIAICFGDEDLAAQTPAPPGDSMIILVQYADATAPGRGDKFTIDSVTWYLDAIVGGGRVEGIWQICVTRSARRDIGGGGRRKLT